MATATPSTDWYDFPQFYDLAFVNDTKPEADFLEEVFKKHSHREVKRLLEPACGSGRQVVEMSARGYSLVGLDLNEKSILYAQKRLKRRKLGANLFLGDMTNFQLDEPVDGAFCMINTFRHLVTDADAIKHLQCVADALAPGAIYILGFHLMPPDVETTCIERWRGESGKTKVSFTLAWTDFNRRKRTERMKVSMLAHTPKGKIRCTTEYPMRLYSAKQWKAVYEMVPDLELVEIYDFEYDTEITRELDNELADAVFVFRKAAKKQKRAK